jgi:tRNA threonylcarbamoyladenosine biosynthesis protein TsaB
MTILVLKTASMEATIELWRGHKRLSHHTWTAGRELSSQLLEEIKRQLAGQKLSFDQLDGIVLFKGPGSFTSLRIGATVANTIAYAESIPIVGESGNEWVAAGLARLAKKQNDRQVIPEYGSAPNITKPKS